MGSTDKNGTDVR